MGIFQENSNDTVDYAAALKKIEKHIEDNKQASSKKSKKEPTQIDSKQFVGEAAANQDQNLSEDDNEELYNQSIDDQGNTINKETTNIVPVKMSLYEREYLDVI